MADTWFDVKGDETLALDWKIDENSTVWEIGGFEGRWAAQIIERYNPFVHIFEPQVWAFEKLQKRFNGNDKVYLHNFGLWTHDANLRLWEHDTDGASVMRHDGRTSEICAFKDIYGQLAKQVKDVDVCLMNIEGAEYVLIPYLMGMGLLGCFKSFWCQFHPRIVDSGELKALLVISEIGKTHNLLWNYFPIAVAWERK